MGSNPLTSSERRGILILAILSLLITGAGLCVAYCDRPATTIESKEVEVLLRGEPTYVTGADSVARVRRDSLQKLRKDSLRKARRDSLRKVRRDSLRKLGKERGSRSGKSKKATKTYRRRSPIDESAQ